MSEGMSDGNSNEAEESPGGKVSCRKNSEIASVLCPEYVRDGDS